MTDHATVSARSLAGPSPGDALNRLPSLAGRPAADAAAGAAPGAAGGRRAAGALALSLITLAFWSELLLEGDRAGFLGSLRRTLLAITAGLPEAVQLAVSAGAPFAALGLALLSLRDVRSRRAGLAALIASAALVTLVVAAALHGEAQ